MDEEEDIDIASLSMNERVALLMEELPAPVQEFLKGPERDAVSLRISQKYGLHADTAGVFERAYLFMLLGVYTPEEFAQELRDAGVDETTVRGIATDVNEQVFKKLRAEEEQGTAPPSQAERAPAVPLMSVEAPPSPAPSFQIPKPETPGINLLEQHAPVSQASSVVIPVAPAPVASRTMAADMEMAAHGLQGNAVSPARSFQTASVPITRMPEPSAPVMTPGPSSAPTTPPIPQPSPPPVPIAKEYGADPYREPLT